MPKRSPNPINKSPSINSQSTKLFPDKATKSVFKGPWVAVFKNPAVGDVPVSQELEGIVENPRPKTLSKNAQRKITDKNILRILNEVLII